MPLEVVTIPCLQDNYAYLAHDPATGDTAVIDVPEAGPIREVLTLRGWRLTDILVTHHHPDHIGGVEELRAATGARVLGAAADAHRLPRLDHALSEGDIVRVGAEEGRVIDVSGHTNGHIAFHFPRSRVVFTADSLMAFGCGRLFEGTGPQMWASLRKLSALPPETLVCSGHEYTLSNAKFARTIEPDNQALISRCDAVEAARAQGRATVPTLLSDEIATNPFLRADQPSVKAALGMTHASDDAVFTEIRSRKDRF
ncbi:hydroxyacylglutathione hydrolase [Plastorhodobacter daqingensis]|uniref:Hydroxyacylglutathione hydrolase n=1 Tax=Plastorhodobacter daqingensis TaxID=1387281 RepID=A0ABW2UMN0_9RHOB